MISILKVVFDKVLIVTSILVCLLFVVVVFSKSNSLKCRDYNLPKNYVFGQNCFLLKKKNHSIKVNCASDYSCLILCLMCVYMYETKIEIRPIPLAYLTYHKAGYDMTKVI